MTQQAYGKEQSQFNGQKINCGFIAPERLSASLDELLPVEQMFLAFCGSKKL